VSSRVKDLVDLALIARSQTVDGPVLRVAILAGTGHRVLPLPTAFAVPDWDVWRTGFTKTITAAPGESMTFAEAVQLVKRVPRPSPGRSCQRPLDSSDGMESTPSTRSGSVGGRDGVNA